MHEAMTRLIKVSAAIVVVSVASIVIFAIFLPIGLSYYDSATRKALLRVVAQEVSPRASVEEMEDFLQRHTIRYAFDQYHHNYSGFLPQTKLDKALFDRKVQVVLNLNEHQAFQSANVRVYYTWL
jgi:hypothetical protein